MAYALGIYAWFTFILRFAPVKPSFPPTGLEQLGSTFAILLAGGILFIPIRGGVTTSTANVGMVYFSQNQFLNHSAINPCFSLIASLSKQQDFASQFDFYPEEKRKALFDTLIQAQDSLCPGDSIPTEPVKLLTTTRPNILIIIMESFTANAIEAVGGEPGITPNLNRLSQEGCIIHEPICQLVPYRSRLSLRIERLFSPTHHLHHEVSGEKPDPSIYRKES